MNRHFPLGSVRGGRRWFPGSGLRPWLPILISTLLALTLMWAWPTPAQSQPTVVATGRGGAVASVDDRATQIGLDILRQGGNAVDAAVATAAALGVVEPFSAGIGGGGFMVIYNRVTDTAVTLDGREEAPAAVTPDLFADPDSPTGAPLPFFPQRISSGLAVGVPGTPLNWATAVERYGTRPLGELLQPAIALAETGFTVDATFAQQIARNRDRFAAFTSTRDLYLPDGDVPAVGSRFRNPDLARTYRQLAAGGMNAFYRGEIGRAIAQTVQAPPTVAAPPFPVWPGVMTLADLDRYEVRVRPAWATAYRGHRLYGMGLPSSGGITVGQILALLESQNLGAMARPQSLHHLLEAERLAFADRNTYLGDPEYVDVPLVGLTQPDYLAQRRSLMPAEGPPNEGDYRAMAGNPLPFQADPSPSLTFPTRQTAPQGPEGQSTTHLTVADAQGWVVSYTLTLESTGGSGMVVPGYGFILNNELTDFATIVPGPNVPEPGKRPRSSMAPTVALAPNGDVLAFGSPGGSTIITTVAGIAVNVLDFEMDLAAAIAAPRFSQRNSGLTLVETEIPGARDLAQSLWETGHKLIETEEIGAATGILVKADGTFTAAAEPQRRGGGSAAALP
jgi:gamma-glutamyltranspeptidase/glutathione hydrolase